MTSRPLAHAHDGTYLAQIPRQVQETGQTIPNLSNQYFPHLGLGRSATLGRLDFAIKQALGERDERVDKVRDRIVGDSFAHDREEVCTARLRGFPGPRGRE